MVLIEQVGWRLVGESKRRRGPDMMKQLRHSMQLREDPPPCPRAAALATTLRVQTGRAVPVWEGREGASGKPPEVVGVS